MNKILILMFLCLSFAGSAETKSANAKVNGVVFEDVRGYKIPLSLASIQCKGTAIGTFSDTTGDFELKLPEGEYNLRFSYAGYKPVEREIIVKKNKVFYFEITLESKKELAQK